MREEVQWGRVHHLLCTVHVEDRPVYTPSLNKIFQDLDDIVASRKGAHDAAMYVHRTALQMEQ